MAKRTNFDIESFTGQLRRDFSKYISRHEVEELENLWYKNKIDRAFSKASAMYHRLPEYKLTEGLRHGIQAFQDATNETSPRYTTSKPIDPDSYVRSPMSLCKHRDSNRYAGSPMSPDRKKANTNIDLVHYIKVLARGIRDKNFDDIKVVQNVKGVNQVIEDLRGIADGAVGLFRQINDLDQRNNTTTALWLGAVDELSKVRDTWQTRFRQLEQKYENLRSSHITKVDTITRLEMEKKKINDRYLEMMFEQDTELSAKLKDTQQKLQSQERYCASLLEKNHKLIESFDNLRYEKGNLEVEIRKYTTTVECLENEISALKEREKQLTDYLMSQANQRPTQSFYESRNAAIKHKTDATNIRLKRAILHGDTLDGYDEEVHKRETSETQESSVSLQKMVEKLEARCSELGERNSSLIHQVQVKKVQLKKATKHVEAKDSDNEELQERLKVANQHMEQIEQEKRELKEKYILLKERNSERNRDGLHYTGELDKLRKENDDLRTTMLFQEDIGNQDKGQRKKHKLSGERDRSKDQYEHVKTSRTYKPEIFHTSQGSADQFLLYKDEIDRLKERIRELEKSKARHGEHGRDDISYRDRLHVTKDREDRQDETDFRIENLEKENKSLKSRLQKAIDIINRPEKSGSKGRDILTDNRSKTDRRQEVGNELDLSGQADSKIKELELENSSLRKWLKDALDKNKQIEKGEIKLEEHGTDVLGFKDSLSETQDQRKQLEMAQSKLEEVERENKTLEERLKEALEKINQMETDDRKINETGTGNMGFKDRLQSTFSKELPSEVSESRVREMETEISSLQERLRNADDKINQLERDNSRLNDIITSGNPTMKERLQYALRRSPSDVSSSRVRELERENRNLENKLQEAMSKVHELDREVQKGSKDSYKSHSGKHKKKIHEKSETRVKDLERENSSLQDSTSKLRRDMDEKDYELRRMTSQLQKAEDDKRELLTRLNSGSENSRVLQGSGVHLAGLQGIATRDGEGLAEIHREKEKVLQAENQAKQFEQENQQLLESQSRLQSQLEEKVQELERLQSELRSHGARNTDQDQDLTFIKPEKEGILHTESQTRQLEQDKRDLTERNEQLQSQLAQHQREVERLQTELRQRDENRTEQSMTDMHHQTGGESLTERQTERFEQQKENLLDRNRDLQKQIDQLKEEVSRLTREHGQKDDYCTELSRNLTDMRRERDMAGQNDGQIRQLEQEKQELQQRLEEALVDSNKVGELESLVMTLENEKREYVERLGQEQTEDEAGIYSEDAPSKHKKAKKIKAYGGEKLHKDKEHPTKDGERNDLDRVKLELLETKQENEDLKKRLNGLQNVKETQREGETDPNGLVHTDIDQIDSNIDPQIVPERQESELSKVKFELQVIKKQKSDLQKRLNEGVGHAIDLQKINELEAHATKIQSEKRELEEKLSNLQAELERVQQKEGRSSRSERINTDQPDGNGYFKRELEQQTNELDRVKLELEETRKQNGELQQRLEDALSASGKLKESKALLTWQTRMRGNLQDGDGDKIVEERIQNVESTPNLTEIPDRHDRNQRLGRESIYGQEDMQRVQSELQKAEENNKNLQERLTLMEQEAEKSQQLENTARRHRRERQELQNRLSDSENTATRLRKERQELRCRNAELEQKNTQSCNELERLSSDLRQSEERNANLSRRLRNADGDSDKVKELEVQVLYLQNEKKQGEERLKRVERETTKREKLETRPKLYGEERGSLPDQSPGLQEQLEKQQIEIARITSELHQTKTEKEELENRLQRLGREMSTTESTVATFRQYEKEKRDTGESNVQLQKLIEEQQTDIQKLNSDLKKSQEESQNLRERLNVAEKKPKKVEELEVQLIYLLNEKKEAEKRTSRLQRKVEQQQAEIQRLHLQLEQVQEQYDDIQTRFSQLASAQLTHDNPNVTDLSDSNRPIKLGDAYSELYDNEWTEAYSALDEDDGNSLQEVEIVMTLRDILLDCFEHCKDTSKKQIDGIKSLLFSPRATSSTVPSGADLTKAQAKMISELRKKTVAQAISSMQQKMTRKYHDRWQYKAVEDFVKKCVELCWPMVVQSPPVFLDGSYKSGDHFDKDVFKAFTKTGTSIDYVVWPPLYLHKGGPILCKGTAQGRK